MKKGMATDSLVLIEGGSRSVSRAGQLSWLAGDYSVP
jgi:hypothetical protein